MIGLGLFKHVWHGTACRVVAIVGVVATLLVGLVAAPAIALTPTTVDNIMWQVNGRVRAIVETPYATYVAGQFTALVGPGGQMVPRLNLAAIDPVTGGPLPFVADVNKPVWDIVVSDDNSTVYAVGDFSRANGATRGRAAAFDATSGATLAWNPNLGARGLAVAFRDARAGDPASDPAGDQVYLGGDFLTVGGQPRSRLAAVHATSGALITDWTATANAAVESIVVTNDRKKVIVGGLFTGISGSAGTTQRKVASLHPKTGALLPWASHPTFEVFDLEVSDSQLFAAAGGSGGHAVAWDLTTGEQQWTTFGDGDAVAVEVQNGVLYIGGHMTTWGGAPASHILAVNPATGTRIAWSPKINSNLGIFSMASFKGHLSIGGDFTRVNNFARQRYARFSENLDPDPPTAPGQPTATADSASSVDLQWSASTDNVESLTYTVFRDGGTTAVGQVTSASTTTVSFTDTNLDLVSTHTWAVQASDGANLSPLSPVSAPFKLPPSEVPLLTALDMLDSNENGRVDAVRATFSSAVTCADPCISPWTLTDVPSGGSLAAVAVTGNTATLTLTEGAGLPSTAVGFFTVALATDPDVVGVIDAEGDPAEFVSTAPKDKASPVPVAFDSTDGVTPDWMEPGDTFSVKFSEPIDPATVIAANVKQLDPFTGTGRDKITIVGLTDGPMDLLEDGIVLPNGGTVVYRNSTLTLLDGNTTIVSTVVGSCTGNACVGGQGVSTPQDITYVPEPTLNDMAGNQATGSHTETLAIY